MMRQLAIIRTHRWGEAEERLLAALRLGFDADVVVAYHNRLRRVTPPLPVVDVTAAWAVTHGLRAVPDFGWRCGDYFYYATRQAHPDYDFYWMIEPDVMIAGDVQSFFASFSEAGEDALGCGLRPFEEDIPFVRGLPGVPHWKAILPLPRVSGRALDHLRPLRTAYGAGPVGNRFFSNDEIFCFSNVMNSPGFTGAPLEKYAADWLTDTSFDTNPTVMLEALQHQEVRGKLAHPVRSKADFKRVVAEWLAADTGFLRRMRYSLQHFGDDDFEQIVDQVAEIHRKALREHRSVGEVALKRLLK